ncbi:MAG TPA: hypothetical protein VKB54_00950 [Solirubrobacteraceae bacterium]|jgi:hypothetical protein|nr:hypothetical protein [Solirubrobacteraceae bacterium]
MIYERFSPPAEHLPGDEESGETAVVDPRARPPYFAYVAALNAMDQPDDAEEERHVD